MTRLTLTALAALAISTSAGMATTFTVDFEDQASGFVTPGTSFDGLIFDTDILIQSEAQAGAAGPGQDGQVASQATPPFGGDPKGNSFGGSFDGFTVSGLTIVVGDSGGDIDIFQLLGFDAAGDLVADSGELRSEFSIPVSISGTGIARFTLEIEDVPAGFDGSSFFDNLSFDAEIGVVPLPATLPLAGFGLMAMCSLARRRKS